MGYFTKEGVERPLGDEEVISRLMELMAMSGMVYSEEVRFRLSPKELEEYLDKGPDKRICLKKQVSTWYIHHVKERPVK